jgi:acetoin utilization deacetylase AcuC-like enzyme
MIVVYTPEHRQHDPAHEILAGQLVPYHEAPKRAEIIRVALEQAAIGPVVAPRRFGLDPILAVHDVAYVAYLERAYAQWVAAGHPSSGVIPDTLPLHSIRRYSANPQAEAGYYCFDLSAVIVAGTYAAARASADVALTGAALLLAGDERFVYALCRPPGHHAGRSLCGGYCFLNNAAIAAQYLLDQGSTMGAVESPQSAVILDIDFHHGNGTQEIFYARADVFFVSIHADPSREYPYFLGGADELGEGPGIGCNLNFPLEAGVTDERFLVVLDRALEAIRAYAPNWLIVSAGFDTFASDPLGDFVLSGSAYQAIGARLAALDLPTLLVQEGGYAVDALGENVVSFLKGFA